MKDSEMVGAIALPTTDERRPRGVQAKIAALMLLAMALPFAAAEIMARSDGFDRWMCARETASSAKENRLYTNKGVYFDVGDKMLLRDLPRADYSKGGVYVVGSSTAIYCLDDYRLAPEQASLIHNYGVYGMNYTQLRQFMRFLIDENHLLSAGADKTMVLVGLSYTDAVEPGPTRAQYFPGYFDRAGVFRYDVQSGITAVPMTALERAARIEFARCRSVVLRLLPGPRVAMHEPLNIAAFRDDNAERLGPDWKQSVQTQLAQLGAMVDDLHKRGVQVAGILIPAGSWNEQVPGHDVYMTRVKALFENRGLPIYDYSHLVKDEDFNDALHSGAAGTEQIHRRLVKIAEDFLRKSGALQVEK
jgi:hypothetical protein